MSKAEKYSIVAADDAGKKGNVAHFVAELLRVPELDSPADYIEEGVRSYSRSAMEMARAGYCWMRAKEGLRHGDFQQAIERAGISYDHVKRGMQLAAFLERVPEDEARKLAGQSYTKVLALAQADPEVIEDIIESGEAEELVGLSVRELKERLKSAERNAERAGKEAEMSKRQLQEITRNEQILELQGELPLFARVPRHETFAFEEATALMLDNLDLVYAENLLGDLKHPQAKRYQPIAAANAVAGLAKVEARIRALRLKLQGAYPDVSDEAVTHDHQLSRAEAAQLEERVKRMKHHIEETRKARLVERDHETTGKRGRPLGGSKKVKKYARP